MNTVGESSIILQKTLGIFTRQKINIVNGYQLVPVIIYIQDAVATELADIRILAFFPLMPALPQVLFSYLDSGFGRCMAVS